MIVLLGIQPIIAYLDVNICLSFDRECESEEKTITTKMNRNQYVHRVSSRFN